MAIESGISWTDATSNFWWGCTAVAPECKNCYAEIIAKSKNRAKWGKDGTRTLVKSTYPELKKLARMASKAGHKKITFVSSMCDVFETDGTFSGQWLNHSKEPIETTFAEQRQRAFDAADEFRDSIHFLFLTKRPQNIPLLTPKRSYEDPKAPNAKYRRNVSFGTSAGTQKTWNEKVSNLLKNDVVNICHSTFVSCEPMLEPVDPSRQSGRLPEVVFVGGESAGKEKVRPMELNWALDLQARLFDLNPETIFHFKQLGSYATWNGEPLKYDHRKGEDPSEWPADLSSYQELPIDWRGKHGR